MDQSQSQDQGPCQGDIDDDGGGRFKKMKMAIVEVGESSKGGGGIDESNRPPFPDLLVDVEILEAGVGEEIVPFQAADTQTSKEQADTISCLSFRYIINRSGLSKQEKAKAKRKLQFDLELVNKQMKKMAGESESFLQRIAAPPRRTVSISTSRGRRTTDVAGPSRVRPAPPSNNAERTYHNSGNGLLEKAMSKAYKKSSLLLKNLLKQKSGYFFGDPVDPKWPGCSDYYTIIKNPMDLGTLRKRIMIINSRLFTPGDFARDVRLTFTNAMTFNIPGHPVHQAAKRMLVIFNDRWTAIETEYERTVKLAAQYYDQGL